MVLNKFNIGILNSYFIFFVYDKWCLVFLATLRWMVLNKFMSLFFFVYDKWFLVFLATTAVINLWQRLLNIAQVGWCNCDWLINISIELIALLIIETHVLSTPLDCPSDVHHHLHLPTCDTRGDHNLTSIPVCSARQPTITSHVAFFVAIKNNMETTATKPNQNKSCGRTETKTVEKSVKHEQFETD